MCGRKTRERGLKSGIAPPKKKGGRGDGGKRLGEGILNMVVVLTT